MTNVIKFPKKQGNEEEARKSIKSLEDLDIQLKEFKSLFVDDISEFILGIIGSEMERANIILENEDFNDVILMVESIKSLMLKKLGVDHQLQQFAIEYSQSIMDDKNEEDNEEDYDESE